MNQYVGYFVFLFVCFIFFPIYSLLPFICTLFDAQCFLRSTCWSLRKKQSKKYVRKCAAYIPSSSKADLLVLKVSSASQEAPLSLCSMGSLFPLTRQDVSTCAVQGELPKRSSWLQSQNFSKPGVCLSWAQVKHGAEGRPLPRQAQQSNTAEVQISQQSFMLEISINSEIDCHGFLYS